MSEYYTLPTDHNIGNLCSILAAMITCARTVYIASSVVKIDGRNV